MVSSFQNVCVWYLGMFGLEKDKLLGRMEMLAKRAAKKIKNKVAPGKPHYTASFLRWSRRNNKKK